MPFRAITCRGRVGYCGQKQRPTKFTCCAPRIAPPCCGARPYAPKIAALAGREVSWRAREALRANALRESHVKSGICIYTPRGAHQVNSTLAGHFCPPVRAKRGWGGSPGDVIWFRQDLGAKRFRRTRRRHGSVMFYPDCINLLARYFSGVLSAAALGFDQVCSPRCPLRQVFRGQLSDRPFGPLRAVAACGSAGKNSGQPNSPAALLA